MVVQHVSARMHKETRQRLCDPAQDVADETLESAVASFHLRAPLKNPSVPSLDPRFPVRIWQFLRFIGRFVRRI